MEGYTIVSFVIDTDIPNLLDNVKDYIYENFTVSAVSENLLPLGKRFYTYHVNPIIPNESWIRQLEIIPQIETLENLINDIRLYEFIIDADTLTTFQKDLIVDYLTVEFSHQFVIFDIGKGKYLPQIPFLNSGIRDYSSIWLSKADLTNLTERIASLPKDTISLSIDNLLMWVLRENFPEILNFVQMVSHPNTSDIIYTVTVESIDVDLVNNIRKEIKQICNDRRADNYFTIRLSSQDKVNIETLIESWKQELVEYNDGIMIIRQENASFFPENPSTFIQRSLNELSRGNLPIVIMGGPWQLIHQNTVENQAKLIYLTLSIGKTFDDYLPYVLDQLVVTSGLSIKIPMVSLNSFYKFKQELINHMRDITSYFIQEVESIPDSFVVRSVLNGEYSNQRYLTLGLRGKIYVVGMKGRTVLINDSLRKQVKDKLTTYFKDISPKEVFTQENIQDLSFADLLKLVKPEESNYLAFLKDLKTLNKGISLMGRKNMTESILKLVDNPSLGVSGYMPCAYLPGFFDQIPSKPKISLPGASVKDFTLIGEIKGEKYEVIDFSEELSSEQKDKLKSLWETGYFLSIHDLYVFSLKKSFPAGYIPRFDLKSLSDRENFYRQIS